MFERVFKSAAPFEREHAWVQVAAERSAQIIYTYSRMDTGDNSTYSM